VTETPNPNIVDADTLTGEMHPIRRCVIAIGSNLGDRLTNLQGAVDALADTPEVWLTDVSPVYETAPVDAPAGSADFLNAVVLADTTLSARTLLDRALAIEDAYGRERGPQRNAPRTLDVDLILVGDRRADDDRLVLPHPKAHERAFVLAPWHDVDPDAEIPEVGTVADLLEKAEDQSVARRDDLTLSAS
jgi:2-amino-4-hydroxy-6-hydroxymethyldihydropteridine diphosphokinase